MSIKPLEVQRDQYGYWSHPDYLAFCDGREFIPTAEFDQWMSEHDLQWKVEYRDEDMIDPTVDGCDISACNLKALKVKAGSLAPSMTLKTVRFVFGSAPIRMVSDGKNHDRLHGCQIRTVRRQLQCSA